jgi:hypothetical protein
MLLSNLMWFSYLVLTTVIYIYYYMKQRVLSTAMNMSKVFCWRKPLLILSICLIIGTLSLGVYLQLPVKDSYIFDTDVCSTCSQDGDTIIVIYIILDFICVVILLVLFLLPLWRFIRWDNGMNSNKALKQTLVRNAFLCSFSVMTTIAAWVTILMLGINCSDIGKDIDIGSQCLVWAIEQFVVCNCVLLTMSDCGKILCWPSILACGIIPNFDCFTPAEKIESNREKFLLPKGINDT